MLRFDSDACEKCISCTSSIAIQTGSKVRVSHYGVTYWRGTYRWFVVLQCKDLHGLPITRNCVINADDDETLYYDLYGCVPGKEETFTKAIEGRLVNILKSRCEISPECPYYDLHFMKQ